MDVRDEDSPDVKQNLLILLVPVVLSDLYVRALSAVQQHLALSPLHHYRRHVAVFRRLHRTSPQENQFGINHLNTLSDVRL